MFRIRTDAIANMKGRNMTNSLGAASTDGDVSKCVTILNAKMTKAEMPSRMNPTFDAFILAAPG